MVSVGLPLSARGNIRRCTGRLSADLRRGAFQRCGCAEAQFLLEHGGRGASCEAALLRSTCAEAPKRALIDCRSQGRGAGRNGRPDADWRRVDPGAKSRLVQWFAMKGQILSDLSAPRTHARSPKRRSAWASIRKPSRRSPRSGCANSAGAATSIPRLPTRTQPESDCVRRHAQYTSDSRSPNVSPKMRSVMGCASYAPKSRGPYTLAIPGTSCA